MGVADLQLGELMLLYFSISRLLSKEEMTPLDPSSMKPGPLMSQVAKKPEFKSEILRGQFGGLILK